MKKIERLKKGLIGMGAFFLTIPTKVFATQIEVIPLYGVSDPRPVKKAIILNLCKIFFIPVALLLIGTIIYLKKSKSSTKRKIIIVLAVMCMIAISIFEINYIVNN